jgi:molecular chaperone DnaK (HSP70)
MEAGFGTAPNHKMEVTLTEAEAAAVYVAKPRLRRGEVFLVCDAGGGTTDCNILKVKSAEITETELDPLSCVQGNVIGSTLIDLKVEKLLEARLNLVRHHIRGAPNVIAHRMMKQGRFETFKRSYGKPESDIRVPLQVLTMEPGLDFPQAHIINSKIFITQEDLRSVFDEQISRIFKLIDDELRGLQQSHSGEKLSYLVLSGGLGSSPYVRKELEARYERGSEFANAENIKILTAPKPQLAVVHGLVMDQVQKLKTNKVVYTTVRCRASYGVLVREVYDAQRHIDQEVVVDRRDGQRWAENQIHWFIRRASGATNHFLLKC